MPSTPKPGHSTLPTTELSRTALDVRPRMTVVPDAEESTLTSDVPAVAAPAAAYDRAYAHILGMNDKQIADVAERLFPENHNQQILFVCWIRGVQNAHRRDINPRSYPPNFIGDSGTGKSAIIYAAAYAIEAWLSEIGGGPLEFQIVVRTLAGVNDLSEIIGIVHLDHQTQRTIIYPRADMPVRGDKTFGLVFLDDSNRGEPGVMSGVMELVNTLAYNGYKMPFTWGLCAAINPAGKNHKVKAWDPAQETRWVKVVLTPNRMRDFLGQMGRQGIPVSYVGYCTKYKHIAKETPTSDMLPEPRITNYRNTTMIGHIFGALQHLPTAWLEVATSNLGAGEMKNLQAMLQGEMPLEPGEILGVNARERKAGVLGKDPETAWADAKPRLAAFKTEGRTDLIAVSIEMLLAHLNHKEFDLSDDQLDVLADLAMTGLPKEAATNLLRRLVLPGAPRADYYKPKLTMWNAPSATEPGPLARHFLQLLTDMKAKLKGVVESRGA